MMVSSLFSPAIHRFYRKSTLFVRIFPLTSRELWLTLPQVVAFALEKKFWSQAGSGNSERLMATTLAPVDSREVVRCDHCHLVQFRTNNHLCRKCRASLDEEPPAPILMEPPRPERTTEGN